MSIARRQAGLRPNLERRISSLELMLLDLKRHQRHGRRLRPKVSFGPGNLLKHLEELAQETKDIQWRAECEGDYRSVIACIRERMAIVELSARLRGEIDSRMQANVLNVSVEPSTVKRMIDTYLARRKTLEDGSD
jgi:hypothetical protein